MKGSRGFWFLEGTSLPGPPELGLGRYSIRSVCDVVIPRQIVQEGHRIEERASGGYVSATEGQMCLFALYASLTPPD